MLSAMMHKPVIAKSLHWYRDHPKVSLISATVRTSLADDRGTRSATVVSPSVDFVMVARARAAAGGGRRRMRMSCVCVFGTKFLVLKTAGSAGVA